MYWTKLNRYDCVMVELEPDSAEVVVEVDDSNEKASGEDLADVAVTDDDDDNSDEAKSDLNDNDDDDDDDSKEGISLSFG